MTGCVLDEPAALIRINRTFSGTGPHRLVGEMGVVWTQALALPSLTQHAAPMQLASSPGMILREPSIVSSRTTRGKTAKGIFCAAEELDRRIVFSGPQRVHGG